MFNTLEQVLSDNLSILRDQVLVNLFECEQTISQTRKDELVKENDKILNQIEILQKVSLEYLDLIGDISTQEQEKEKDKYSI